MTDSNQKLENIQGKKTPKIMQNDYRQKKYSINVDFV